MWKHYCLAEKCWMKIGKNQPCNWCGKEELK